jgi:hypothetical protein
MSRRRLNPVDYINDMVEASDHILQFTAGFTESDFLASRMVQYAVFRATEVIGKPPINSKRSFLTPQPVFHRCRSAKCTPQEIASSTGTASFKLRRFGRSPRKKFLGFAQLCKML